MTQRLPYCVVVVSVACIYAVSRYVRTAAPTPSSSPAATIGATSSRVVSMAVKEFVDSTIKDNKVVIFSKSYCPFCHKAKRSLGSVVNASKITVIELDQRQDGDEIQDELLSLTGGRSVPRVFINQKFIGGGDDTARLAGTGELASLVKGI